MESTSVPSAASNSVAAAASASASSPVSATGHSPPTSPTKSIWSWPAAAVVRDTGDETTGRKRWYWRVIAGANDVSKRTFFSDQSSRQLDLVLSHWMDHHSDPMSTRRIERGDQQLAGVWQDLCDG